ncbi:MAG TPA: ATP-binding protein [Alkalispirochaeta sp.]|nr:ATP-binding protein [Alkalispirochaeta sp.]
MSRDQTDRLNGGDHIGFALTTRLRLTLLYTSISILSVVAIFALTFFSLYRTLQQDDLREMQNRLLSYWAQFQTGGIELLQEEIGVDNLLVGERPFFVRVADTENDTVLFSYPRVWQSFSFDRLERMELEPNEIRVLRSEEHDYTVEVSGIWLSEEYFLQLGLSDENRQRLMGLFQRNFLLIAAVVAVAGFSVGLLIATRALRPISRVTAVARRIVDTGRLDARVEQGTGGRELTQLVDVINAMLGTIQRLVDGMRNTVDMVAHDLRTPITRLRARAELALRSGDVADTEAALAETVEQSDEILRMINTLLDITEAESGVMHLSPERVLLPELLEEVRDLYEMVAEDRGITLRLDVPRQPEQPSALFVQGDRLRLRQVVANLVDNAVKYCRQDGLVTLSARTLTPDSRANAPAGGRVAEIAVSDTGPGLSETERERVWDRMYRGPIQPNQRGLGLGLSLVRAVVQAHDGSVDVQSTPGTGSRFAVRLPQEPPRTI